MVVFVGSVFFDGIREEPVIKLLCKGSQRGDFVACQRMAGEVVRMVGCEDVLGKECRVFGCICNGFLVIMADKLLCQDLDVT